MLHLNIGILQVSRLDSFILSRPVQTVIVEGCKLGIGKCLKNLNWVDNCMKMKELRGLFGMSKISF